MYVRKKRNRSGTTSVVVVDKSSGRFRELKTIGVSSDEQEIEKFFRDGKRWISIQSGERDMFAEADREREQKQVTEHLLNNIENILLNGTQLILNQVFKLIGFDVIKDEIFRHLVVARLCQPSSKAGTVDYLKSYFDEDVELHEIYRYLDRLHSTQQEALQQISVEHTRGILGGKIGLVFYDVTTLYFETDLVDDLRKPGFSKDGKHSLPQVVLGLLVSEGGYPLAYSIHEGNKYEGHTMLPVVEDFIKRFDLKEFVIVADSGLMNSENLRLLEANNYKYIIGARIRNEGAKIRNWILSLEKIDGRFYEYNKSNKCRLIIGYSKRREEKDVYNRNKGVHRLEKEFRRGTITKENINKRGYNKFLELSEGITVNIDYEKVRADECWDGLKGYITNADLPADIIHKEYSGLWQVENAFRVTKGTLELRPMFHFTAKRIKAHVCICFVAYKVYKELGRILKLNSIDLSVDKVLNIAKTVTTIKVKLPVSGEVLTKTMLMTKKHHSIKQLFDQDFWKNV